MRELENSQEAVIEEAVIETVRTRRLIVSAADGSPRVEIGTSNGGDALVRLRDQRGVVRAVLSVQDDMPRVRLLDENGAVRLCGILRDGEPGFELLDAQARPRLVMFLRGHEGEAPDLYFVDQDGSPRFGMSLDSSGEISVAAQDAAGLVAEPLWFRRQASTEDEPLD
jgi:hypothetical protein